ncbi:MAG TPA: glutamate formimidoyltransferase [Prolixibacteraceae bacterium]|jgi:glutamate formiminotransferase/formiminotetrahydrofolate cyclodeaminase|nr:glutamate formimidoyltransferase [Prolixibacteraceae bacterium]
MKQLIECVPNFSEGRDEKIINQITEAIQSVDGIKLLNVDPGKATNRTVVTFVGEPEQVIEAAFRGAKMAAQLIDMTKHKGEHPRFGAIDVCPLVPIAHISMEETVVYARRLAQRMGVELGISVYCYEAAAFSEERQSLANCRAGEYEGLALKLQKKEWAPDFGPSMLNVRSGASAVGARNFLIAYNVNLNTTSVRRANSIAFDVREAGRILREGDPVTGTIVTDANGQPVRIPGTLQKVRAIGWFIKEYGIAQISMNLTDITITSMHQAFAEVEERARERGIRVTGSELIGVIPLKAMLDAGKYFLHKQQRSTGIPEQEIIKIAIKSLGLDELTPFDPRKRIIEYLIDDQQDQLINLSLQGFSNETLSESPAPGGGSVAAYVGALGAALGSMVANLSAIKRGWDSRWEEFSDWAEKGKVYHDRLLKLVDEDSASFNAIMDAFGMPKTSDSEKKERSQAIQAATKQAIEIPFQVMQASFGSMEVIQAMATIGNPNSLSDAGVGALCARTAVYGAYLNVRINAASLTDKVFAQDMLTKAKALLLETQAKETEILSLVESD